MSKFVQVVLGTSVVGTALAVFLAIYLRENWTGSLGKLVKRLKEKHRKLSKRLKSQNTNRIDGILGHLLCRNARERPPTHKFIHRHISSLIGNTPILELTSLSELTGCTILGKCEFMNPGGSSKDRLALQIIMDAHERGDLKMGKHYEDQDHNEDEDEDEKEKEFQDQDEKENQSKKDSSQRVSTTICEGTVGSTGISLTMLCQSFGLISRISMPSDTSREKSDILMAMGAQVERVKPASIVDPEMFVNRAREFAATTNGAIFADQFETESNFWAHYNGTGPEIWNQVGNSLDAIVMGAGTGGTISGVSTYLHEKNADILVVLADPQGSSLFNLINSRVCHAFEQNEGTRRRHQTDTIVEGIGLQRVTKSLAVGLPEIDRAIRITDQQAINMSRFLLEREGLFLGSSSAVMCAAAVALARDLGPGHVILTMLCDSGSRYLTKLWNDKALVAQGFTIPKRGANFKL